MKKKTGYVTEDFSENKNYIGLDTKKNRFRRFEAKIQKKIKITIESNANRNLTCRKKLVELNKYVLLPTSKESNWVLNYKLSV
jgi:hypothetical protein